MSSWHSKWRLVVPHGVYDNDLANMDGFCVAEKTCGWRRDPVGGERGRGPSEEAEEEACRQRQRWGRGRQEVQEEEEEVSLAMLMLFSDFCSVKLIWWLFKGEPKHRCILAWKYRNCATIYICQHRLVVLLIFLQKKYFFASDLSSSSHVGSLFTNEEEKKVWLLAYSVPLLHIVALFVVLLVQTAEHKMATFKHQILTDKARNGVKHCCVSAR